MPAVENLSAKDTASVKSQYHTMIRDIFSRRIFAWPGTVSCGFTEFFFETSRKNGLIPVIFSLLSNRPDFFTWPADLQLRMKTLCLEEAARDTFRELELIRVLEAFHQDQIPVLILKGAALGYLCYGAPHLRPRSDTDIWIPESCLSDSVRLMNRLGYSFENAMHGTDLSYQRIASYRDEMGIGHVFDIHTKLFNPKIFSEILSFEEMQGEAVSIQVGGAAFNVPSKRHALFHACIHRTAHHHNYENLIWLYDIDLLARSLDQAGLKDFWKLAAQKKMYAVCRDGFKSAARWFETPVNLSDSEENPSHEPSAKFLTLQPRLVEVFLFNMGAASWKSKLKVLKDYVFPPSDFIRAKYPAHRNLWLPLLYAWRLLAGVRKLFSRF